MTQPEALRLADRLMEPVVLDKHAMQAADELRRLHAENEELLKDKARLDWLQKAADALETQAMTPPTLQAAYELRRLHADNEKKSEAIQKLWKERDELRDSNEANAHLIAAAPDLLRELQILADYAERNGARVGAARAAIAKAEKKT